MVAAGVAVAASNGILGVVLVGGRSSRMGQNKALLEYKGMPLVEHAQTTLHMPEVTKIILGGRLDGYETVPDITPHEGPAKAMAHIMESHPDFDGYLFVPVDMPLLGSDTLHRLLQQEVSAFYEGWPLPTYIRKDAAINKDCKSVRALLDAMGAKSIKPDMVHQSQFMNVNSPDEWKILEAL